MNRNFLLLILAFALVLSCKNASFVSMRQQIPLSGMWKFELDSTNIGISQKWYTRTLSDSVKLPGTLDENKKGILNLNKGETMRLSREFMYDGKAWYQQTIIIPNDWADKSVSLFMERTKPSQVWVDTILIGKSTDILTPQVYNLSGKISPGKHTLTLLIDNGKGSVPDGITGSHAWTEHTQTNWNGIIGKFYLEAANRDHFENVLVFPDVDKKNIGIKANVIASVELNAEIVLQAESWNSNKKQKVAKKSFPVHLVPGENIVEVTYEMEDPLQWSEFDPALYKLSVTLKTEKNIDNYITNFGMRKFSTQGTQFTINNLKTFLRGKHDACVFPLTGHPPMDVDAWRKVFQIAKSYHINFYRFHSWTPPPAAFEAADIEGIYMQPELPFWGSMNKDNKELNDFMVKEGDHILNEYGNHASFVMFALGNELSGDLGVMKDFVKHFRAIDGRQLYAYGSNNYLGTKGQVEGEDYYAACRVGADNDTTYKTHIRASFSFADANEGGYINGRYPSTNLNYSGALTKCNIPAVGTEVGQYQIYPNYDEIKKYTGVLKPWNLQIFEKRLKENNLSSQAKDFFMASGALSVICYKADIEMAMRTPGFGGFHLLDLQDFPGQGTALVGILDAFMDSKGLITPDGFSEFCNSVVPLFVTDRYCWSNNEKLSGKIQLANYGPQSLKNQKVNWSIKTKAGEVVAQNTKTIDASQGSLTDVTTIQADLSKITKAEDVLLSISLEGTPYKNNYSLWIYPTLNKVEVPKNITIAYKIDKITLQKLNDGANVLFIPNHQDIKELSVGGLFTPDYWNYRMFKGISEWVKKPVSPGTMGILTDPRHPLYHDFPTEFHSNWQWWAIAKNSRPFILDKAPEDYKPIVQVVDNIERNHKLGIIFEFAVGKGKLMVCTTNLNAIQDKPEGKQLYKSILNYMNSGKFSPQQKITVDELRLLFSSVVTSKNITGVKNISYE